MNGDFTSKKLQKVLGPDFSVVGNNNGFDIYSGPVSPSASPVAYVDSVGYVRTLPGGGSEAAQVRSVLNTAARKNGNRNSKSLYVNRPLARRR